jgi:hypothetical protein
VDDCPGDPVKAGLIPGSFPDELVNGNLRASFEGFVKAGVK